MGAPITHHVAEEMCRVVARPGKIYLYDPNETDRKMFEAVALPRACSCWAASARRTRPPFNEITLLGSLRLPQPEQPATPPRNPTVKGPSHGQRHLPVLHRQQHPYTLTLIDGENRSQSLAVGAQHAWNGELAVPWIGNPMKTTRPCA
jgi:hypothetical protein